MIEAGTERTSSSASAPIASCSAVVENAGRTGGIDGSVLNAAEAVDVSCCDGSACTGAERQMDLLTGLPGSAYSSSSE